MNYKNFGEYWEANKSLLSQLNVSKEAAHLIWNAAVDCCSMDVLSYAKNLVRTPRKGY